MKNENAAARVLHVARSWLGTPYRHQASLKGVGCDCLGLVRGVWREVQGEEPESVPLYSSAWAECGGQESLLDAAARNFLPINIKHADAGDVVVFRMRRACPAKHVGILDTQHSFLHAYEGNCVVESTLDNFWLARVVAAFRFPVVGEGEKS